MLQHDWDATVNRIKESLPQAQFHTWIKPVAYLRSDQSSIVLGVPSKFHEEWLRNNYSDRIAEAIHNQCGNHLQLEFEVLVSAENLEAAQSPDPTPGTSSARPALRLVEGNAGHDAAGETAEEAIPEAFPEAPNVPPFNSEYLELGFNQIAFRFAQMFVSAADQQINPVIFQAGVGMGKTHLLHEIASQLYQQNPRLRIRYTNSVNFTAEMVSHIKNNTVHKFQDKYRRSTDILLFDDLSGIAGRKRSEEELLHIFNEILARGGRIAFTTTQSPHRTEFVDAALKSRLTSAVLAEIRFPTVDERLQMLSLAAMEHQIPVDETVLRLMAERNQNDVREVLGTLLRLHLQAKLSGQSLDREFLAKEGLVREQPRDVITIDEIVALVENNFGIDRNELMSKSRKNVTTWARQVAMFLARQFTLMPLEEIGKTFGRDHSTVIHAFQKVTETIAAHPQRRYEVEFLRQRLQSRSPRGGDVLPI